MLHDVVVTLSWTLRTAERRDVESLFDRHRAAMRSYVEATWGPWDEEWQKQRFVENFASAHWHVIEIAGGIAGMVSWEEKSNEL
jgi:hypothetical protein